MQLTTKKYTQPGTYTQLRHCYRAASQLRLMHELAAMRGDESGKEAIAKRQHSVRNKIRELVNDR